MSFIKSFTKVASRDDNKSPSIRKAIGTGAISGGLMGAGGGAAFAHSVHKANKKLHHGYYIGNERVLN